MGFSYQRQTIVCAFAVTEPGNFVSKNVRESLLTTLYIKSKKHQIDFHPKWLLHKSDRTMNPKARLASTSRSTSSCTHPMCTCLWHTTLTEMMLPFPDSRNTS